MNQANQTTISGNYYAANGFSDYIIGQNICNAFCIGEIGAEDDFFLIGAPASNEDAYPMLTGNFLDSEGNLLFRLVRNVLEINPRDCSKVMGEHIGYEIVDGQDNPILKVKTTFSNQYFTRISGTFYGKGGAKVVSAGDDGLIWPGSTVKNALGFGPNGFVTSFNYTADEEAIIPYFLRSGGKINKLLRGEIKNVKINLDGKLLVDASLIGCEISISKGYFHMLRPKAISGCQFNFDGLARGIFQLVKMLEPREDGTGENGTGTQLD